MDQIPAEDIVFAQGAFHDILRGIIFSNDKTGFEDLLRNLTEVAQRATIRLRERE